MSPARMSKIEEAMRVVMQFNDAFNQHDVPAMMALMSEDCLFENTAPAPDGTVYKGQADVRQFWESFFQESLQAHIEIEEIFGFGERCVMRWKYSWGSGHVRGVDVFKVRDGLITEKLSYVKG
ncbi:MAG: nuclear transport factor 2 family protein [Anaerolineae bacterium]|nr:nuclear transport factor 2 family protein [Anaerolineae bacterium]